MEPQSVTVNETNPNSDTSEDTSAESASTQATPDAGETVVTDESKNEDAPVDEPGSDYFPVVPLQADLGEDASPDAVAAADQAQDDAVWRAKNPDLPLIREANPAVGGERF